MNRRWRIITGLTAAVAVAGFLLLRGGSKELNALEKTRRELREQGFKIDLSEFNFSISSEMRDRAAGLTNAIPNGLTLQGGDSAQRFRQFQNNRPNLLISATSNSAIVVWRQDKLSNDASDDFWQIAHGVLDEHRTGLDAAGDAALTGSIGFDLDASRGTGMLLAHLAALRTLGETLSLREIVELHEGQKTTAWKDLLATTRLVTAWEPESVEVSHLLRFTSVTTAFGAAWQALQSDGWLDEQLAGLQREWESVDFFKRLPETAAFSRAGAAALCQQERKKPEFPPQDISPKEMLHSPGVAWGNLEYRWKQSQYFKHGTFEDERDILLHYRDREVELRRAVQSPTWSAMSQLPGVTNSVLLRLKNASRVSAQLNLKQFALATSFRGQNLISRAAEAETRRRVIITAIALERFRVRNGAYPKSLAELTPGFLKSPLVDFIDGKPLRYRTTDDGHFVLYSIGLDCVDDGGTMQLAGRKRPIPGYPDGYGPQIGTDLVWPRPASAAEATAKFAEEKRVAFEELQAVEKREAEEEARQEQERKEIVEKLLADAQAGNTTVEKELVVDRKPISRLLQNDSTAGKVPLKLDELLTLRQVLTGEEPNIATFEVPIRYEVATNLGEFHLRIDGGADSHGEMGEFQDCVRATNGDSLLSWNTTYDAPGKHAIQAELILNNTNDEKTVEVRGPVVPYFSSNLCRFDPFYATFDSKGGTLFAKLPESNGVYTIEVKSPSGEIFRTFKGTTSNGVIKVDWDLTDEHGAKYTNDSFDTVYHVSLPDSGRSQTMKGQ